MKKPAAATPTPPATPPVAAPAAPAARGGRVSRLSQLTVPSMAQSVASTEPLLTLLDEQLSRRAFMAGDWFTMADIPIVCAVHRWYGLPVKQPSRAHLERWYRVILAQPATRGVLDIPLS